MSAITTHVLDLDAGLPAAGVRVRLARRDPHGDWTSLSEGATDAAGRAGDLLPEGAAAERGLYRLTFAVGEYFARRGRESFYREIPVEFEISDPSRHHHVPLLLSPFGYSTYRGN